jgi:tRNA (cmo5U34)-methyltransferase
MLGVLMLERMDEFFDSRLDGYEEHMLSAIEGAGEFYPFTAEQLPMQSGARVLDLGCGTGLELKYYLARNPRASIMGIDLACGMLEKLRSNLLGYDVTTICASYFDYPFGEECFDGAVSVESLHHFTAEEKIPLYKKVYSALKPGSSFILTDYFSKCDEEEKKYRSDLLELREKQGITDEKFYHFDTPLTTAHEIEALKIAGFDKVEALCSWGATSTIKANK